MCAHYFVHACTICSYTCHLMLLPCLLCCGVRSSVISDVTPQPQVSESEEQSLGSDEVLSQFLPIIMISVLVHS